MYTYQKSDLQVKVNIRSFNELMFVQTLGFRV
jgi:hypothetical protein